MESDRPNGRSPTGACDLNSAEAFRDALLEVAGANACPGSDCWFRARGHLAIASCDARQSTLRSPRHCPGLRLRAARQMRSTFRQSVLQKELDRILIGLDDQEKGYAIDHSPCFHRRGCI